jgi:hypothetical protein
MASKMQSGIISTLSAFSASQHDLDSDDGLFGPLAFGDPRDHKGWMARLISQPSVTLSNSMHRIVTVST